MFAKLPQKLTAPLGLLSDEAKLAFRSRPEGISKLISTRVRLSSGPSMARQSIPLCSIEHRSE